MSKPRKAPKLTEEQIQATVDCYAEIHSRWAGEDRILFMYMSEVRGLVLGSTSTKHPPDQEGAVIIPREMYVALLRTSDELGIRREQMGSN